MYIFHNLLHLSVSTDTDTPKSFYFAYFYSIMEYGITFWSNPCNSRKIFTLKEKVISIMAGVKPRNSCESLFKRIKILTFHANTYFH
jgi:hypothetical protein